MTGVLSVSNAFIQVLLVMVLFTHVLPLPIAAHLPMHDSIYDEPSLVDYNFVPDAEIRINDKMMSGPFRAEKRKNEFIRFGKRSHLIKFNKRKNEFIRFG